MDTSLRPRAWDEYVGQAEARARLDVHIEASLELCRPLPHVFLVSPPGFGKTSLASIIAARLCDPFYEVDLKAVTPNEFHRFLYSLEEGGVVLVDEFHKATVRQQEELLQLMEDGYVITSNNRRIEVPWVTVIAATTKREKIDPAVMSRFSIRLELQAYSDDEMRDIVTRLAAKAEVALDDATVNTIAMAAAGAPRDARHLVELARDLGASGRPVNGDTILGMSSVHADGLTPKHVEYLDFLDRMDEPTGLKQLSTMLRLHPDAVEDLERLMFERGYITFTKAGRDITNPGKRRLHGDPTPDRKFRKVRAA